MRRFLEIRIFKYLGFGVLFFIFLNSANLYALTVDEVGREIMSPPCGYLMTLETCKTGEAKELRKLVKNMIDKGMNKEEIKAYFVREYGEKVLGAPAKKGFNLLAYYLPYLLVIDAFLVLSLIILFWTRRKKTPNGDETVPADDMSDEKYAEKIERDIKSLDA